MRFSAIKDHARRARFQFGQRLRLGGHAYRVRGFSANRLTTMEQHEQHLLAPLQRALAARSGAFFDVGVNTGQTLLKLLRLDPARRYLGFEPQIGCAFFVEQFLRDNRLNGAVICAALSDAPGILPIYSRNEADVMATLLETPRYGLLGTRETFVPILVGDSVVSRMGVVPGVLKIDVEGAEIEVLRGFCDTIAKHRPICFFELLPNFHGAAKKKLPDPAASDNRRRADAIAAFFAEMSYTISMISSDGSEHPISAFDLDNPDRVPGSDYVATPA